MYFKKKYLLTALIFTIVVTGCKKWDSTKVNNADLNQNLADAIAANTGLAKFNDYIKRTGVDKLLQSSKTFTVWAPNDAALAGLDPAIVADTAKLRLFVLNHISYELYFTKDVQTSVRVSMLSAKYNNFFPAKFEDANIVTADKYVRNGVLHIIDKAILVLPSVWDYINSTAATYLQNSFIAGLNYLAFDASLATIDSISSSTGLPVYHPGTGLVTRNYFNDKVFDVKREDKQYTYFVIANSGFTLKADSLKPYFKATATATTDSLDRWNIVKDLVFDTLYPTAASIPAVLLSKFGISVPINKTLIIDTKKLSNGVAYVLTLSDVPTYAKFQQKIIEGESPSGFLSDKTGNTNYRVRRNPVTGLNFSDILVSGHGVTNYYSYYRLNEMPSMKYNVYAFAVNDFQTGALTQNVVFNYLTPPVPPPTTPPSTATVFTTLATLAYAVPLSTAAGAYNEVSLGTFTSTSFGTLEIRLTAAGTTPIVLDYIRLVPVP